MNEYSFWGNSCAVTIVASLLKIRADSLGIDPFFPVLFLVSPDEHEINRHIHGVLCIAYT